jgi:hypothetical protein
VAPPGSYRLLSSTDFLALKRYCLEDFPRAVVIESCQVPTIMGRFSEYHLLMIFRKSSHDREVSCRLLTVIKLAYLKYHPISSGSKSAIAVAGRPGHRFGSFVPLHRPSVSCWVVSSSFFALLRRSDIRKTLAQSIIFRFPTLILQHSPASPEFRHLWPHSSPTGRIRSQIGDPTPLVENGPPQNSGPEWQLRFGECFLSFFFSATGSCWAHKFGNDAGFDPCEWTPEEICHGAPSIYDHRLYSYARLKGLREGSVLAPAFSI